MAVKIRLFRMGAKKRPFYRVVAVDERVKRDGRYLELLGTYNPLVKPHEIILKKERIDYWIKQGAIPSEGYLRMTKQAPQKPPRKPKKEKKEEPPKPQEQKIETATEEIGASQTPVKEVAETPPEAEETISKETSETLEEDK